MKRHDLYAQKFEDHILNFIKEYHLLDSGKRAILAVSGGVDSVVLAHVFYRLKIPFEIVHFNHQTRPLENKKESAFVQALAEKYKAPFIQFEGEFSLTDKNFEARARAFRKKHFHELQKKKAIIFTAHHLNDSLEWTLMQESKQGSLKSTLGIPVRGPSMRRPLLCVTKKHILRYAHSQKLSWCEDASNEDVSFERNFIRQKILKSMLTKYPRLLRHYVAQKNELAQLLGVHTHSSHAVLPLLNAQDESGGTVLSSSTLRPHKAELKDFLLRCSTKSRGEVDAELDKLIKAHEHLMVSAKASRLKGPMSFSGGVEVFLCHQDLLIINQTHKIFFYELDAKLVKYLDSQFLNLTQIPCHAMKCFPGLIFGHSPMIKKESLLIHPLFPQTCAWLKNNKVPYGFAPVLPDTIRQKIYDTAVVLASSDLNI